MLSALWTWLRGSRLAVWAGATLAALAWWRVQITRAKRDAVEKRDREAEAAARDRAAKIRKGVDDVKEAAKRRERDTSADLERLRERGLTRDGDEPGDR